MRITTSLLFDDKGIYCYLYSYKRIIISLKSRPNCSWILIPDFYSQFLAGPVESAVCGSAAGICGKILLYPLEICKKRLEIQGFDRSRYKFGASKHYNGLVDCIQTILREEGLKGMYKGLNPTLLKAAVTTGIHFSVYDQICHMIVSHRQR